MWDEKRIAKIEKRLDRTERRLDEFEKAFRAAFVELGEPGEGPQGLGGGPSTIEALDSPPVESEPSPAEPVPGGEATMNPPAENPA